MVCFPHFLFFNALDKIYFCFKKLANTHWNADKQKKKAQTTEITRNTENTIKKIVKTGAMKILYSN